MGATERLGKRLVRKLAVDAEQILSEAKLFFNPKVFTLHSSHPLTPSLEPADIVVPLKGRRKRGHKSRSECVQRRRIRAQFNQRRP